MLEKYAQEISEYLSGLMGRSIIITDINGIIIGAPAKERLGEFHPPSLPCIKYKKMSFDDEDAARKLGVWYPGSTVPLFFNNHVIGTAAIAGEPEVVLQFSTLVKNQIEIMLREKIYTPSIRSSQSKIDDLVRDISTFDPRREDHSQLPERAERLGIQLDVPRGVIAIFFSNFRGLGLEKNPVRLSYKSNSDPISDEIDYGATRTRVIEIIREIFSDPQNIIASVSRDRFVIFYKLENFDERNLSASLTHAKSLSQEIWDRLKDASIETIIGVGHPAQNIYEMPFSYSNAWEVVSIADKLSMQPAVYCFNEMLLEHLLLSVSPHYSLKYLEKKLADCQKESDTADLVETFSTYCECFFSKQKAAEKLHLHRNTLAYRLAKTEEKFNLSMDNFEEVIAFYLVILMKKLGSSGGTKG